MKAPPSHPTRRRILQGGLLATLPIAAADKPASPVDAEPAGVELAIATICLDGFDDLDFARAFEILPKTPFRNVEFNCWYPRNLTPAGLASIAGRCRERGLRPVCVQGAPFGDGSDRDVAHKLWCMEAARRLGCRRVKFTGRKRGTEGGLDAVIGALRQLAPAAEEMDVLICVENHAHSNLETIDDYRKLFAAIDSTHVGLCLDTGHFTGAAVSIPEVIERFGERTNHVDLKDCKAVGEYKTVPFGTGATDLHGAVEALLARDYRGYLVVEQAPPVRPDALVEDLRAAHAMFRRHEG